MCRLKWVMVALPVLWPRGTFWLMELMLTLGGSLGFPLVFQFFWASWFLKLPQTFSPLLLRHTCYIWENYPPTHFDFLLAVAFPGGLCAAALPKPSPLRYIFLPCFLFPFISMPMKPWSVAFWFLLFPLSFFFFFFFLFGFTWDSVCPSMVSSSEVRTKCPSISFLFVRLGGSLGVFPHLENFISEGNSLGVVVADLLPLLRQSID